VGGVRLEVTNHGRGLEPPDSSRLFDPLKRGSSHADTRQARDGLGLGLFIVSEVVRAHGGEVEVRSHGDEVKGLSGSCRRERRTDGARLAKCLCMILDSSFHEVTG